MLFTYSDTDTTTDVPTSDVQATTFMDDGDVFLMYVAGDCDVFLPYNLLGQTTDYDSPINDCEHPGVFAHGGPDEFCWKCGRNVPITEL